MFRLRFVLAAGTALMAASLGLGNSPAAAGTYTVSAGTSAGIGGWFLDSDPGFHGCSLSSRPGPCDDGDVPSPTPLRLFAKGSVAADGQAFWRWMAPPGVTILGGSAKVTYRTTADTRVFMKARLRNEGFAAQPQVHNADDDGSVTWSVPGGREVFGIFIKSLANHTFNDKWQNNVRIDSFQLQLRDDTPPTAAIGGSLVDGGWLSSPQPRCLDVDAADQGSGITSAVLVAPLGTEIQRQDVPWRGAYQPGDAVYSGSLCAVPNSFADGEHLLAVRVTDAAGEAVSLPLTLRVDAHAPSTIDTFPAAATVDRRPSVSFGVDAGPSGLASFDAELDGVPMPVSGSIAAVLPADDLAYGLHTVTWTATDMAGNARDGFWTFRVVDEAAPVIDEMAPAPATASEDRRPLITFRLSDEGSGIDPTSIRVLLDGSDVGPFGSYTGGVFSYRPGTELSFGSHELRVAASDRSGNQLVPAIWHFTVVDRTPPVLADVRPDPGSSSSDRTPEISVAVSDTGTGVDPASVELLIDGLTVAVAIQGGRAVHVPAQPLHYGLHQVTVSAADAAGNEAEALRWSFEVRDETPPVISGHLPAGGSTVAGAAVIGFDLADSGVGVDPDSLLVTVDGSDVTAWGGYSAGRFRYAPGNLGAGVHTVAVTVADRSGNVAGPVMWQFAVADPATLSLVVKSAPGTLVAGRKGTLVLSLRSGGMPLAGAQLRVSTRPAGGAGFGPGRVLTASPAGEVRWQVAPMRTTRYRFVMVDDPSVEATRTVAVRQSVSLSPSAFRLRRGMPLRLSGRVLPVRPGGRVQVQMLTARGWRTVAAPTLGARSGYAATVVPRIAGRYLLRVVAPGTSSNLAGASRTVSVWVR